MKALLRIAALLGLLLGTAPVYAAEYINLFDSNVMVAKDGELAVTETIDARAEGRAIRHGIYRDFPLYFRDAAGTLREVTFKSLSVERDGRPEPYHTERMHNFIRIYFGDKDTLLRSGVYEYVFRYRTNRQVRWFDNKPELNWNVTGNFWQFPIYTARYHLHLAENARPVRWLGFTGKVGERGTDWNGAVAPDGTLNVESTRALLPGQGLTVVAELPQGSVNPPSQSDLLWYQMFDNRQWIIGGVGFLLVLGYYLVSWFAVGRDPKGGTIIPLFHPPAGISPALANYIHDWGFGREKWRAFTAAALSLAVRGLIRFDQSGNTLMLTKASEPKGGYQTIPAGERAIYSWVNIGGIATIDKAHGESVAKVGDEFTKSIEKENRNRFFRRNLGYVIAGLVMTAAVVVAVGSFGGLQDQDMSILVGLGFAGYVGGFFVVPLIMQLFSAGGRIDVIVKVGIGLIVAAIIISTAGHLVYSVASAGISRGIPALEATAANFPFPFVLVAAFTALNGMFFYLMRAPTALGRPVMDQIDGLRLYLQTAESDRLNMQAPEITAAHFEELLPYAVALDVEKPWADAFAAALKRAHPGDADPMSHHYQPGWGSGSNWSGGGGNFSNSIASSVAGFSAALASAVPVSSGSSGFGGGGGSGGGGGGGGGGGW